MKTLSEVLFVSNRPRSEAPVTIPEMYTRQQFRDYLLLVGVIALFIGIVLGYGWHFAATEHRAASQLGRRGQQFRDYLLLVGVIALFIGIVLGYGWHFAATEHRAASQLGRRG